MEIGEHPRCSDFGLPHVHLALVLYNRKSFRTLVKELKLSKTSYGLRRSYYLAPRDRKKSFRGWLEHHKKKDTKVTPEKPVFFEFGTIPLQYLNEMKGKNNPAKLTQREALKLVVEMYRDGKQEEALVEFPDIVSRHHPFLTSQIKFREEDPETIDHRPRMWIWGPPGTGKSAYVHWKFPRHYKKSLAKNEVVYWNNFDPQYHDYVYLEDIGHDAFRNIGMEQIKQWSDPSNGYTINFKYGAPVSGIRTPLVITSNFHPFELFKPGQPGIEQEKAALVRRFEILHIDELLKRDGVRLASKERLTELKAKGNVDYSKCFEKVEAPEPHKKKPRTSFEETLKCSSEDLEEIIKQLD